MFAALLGFAVAASAQEQTTPANAVPEQLTLQQAFALAISQNPSIGRARAEINAAEATRKGTLASILPHVQFSGSAIRNTENVSFGSGDDSRTILPQNDWNYRITVNQPIYAGNRERRAYEQAKVNVLSAREGLRASEDGILLRVAADYLAVVQGEALVNVEESNVTLAGQRLKQAQNFFEAGEVTKLEVFRGEAAVKAAQRQRAAAVQLRDTAAGRLRIDLNVDRPVVASDPSVSLPSLTSESELIARAQANRPEVKQAENNLKIAKLEVQKQRGAYLPVLTADAAWIEQKSTFPADAYGQGALRLTIPIWQGGEIGQRIAVAREREEQAKLALQEQQQVVREDVRKALLDLQTAETTLGLAQEELQAAQAEYDQTFESYRAQESTSLDVQSAESNLADARRAVVTSTLDRDLARLRLSYVTGNLKDAVLEGK
jgi:outer membrane protein